MKNLERKLLLLKIKYAKKKKKQKTVSLNEWGGFKRLCK